MGGRRCSFQADENETSRAMAGLRYVVGILVYVASRHGHEPMISERGIAPNLVDYCAIHLVRLALYPSAVRQLAMPSFPYFPSPDLLPVFSSLTTLPRPRFGPPLVSQNNDHQRTVVYVAILVVPMPRLAFKYAHVVFAAIRSVRWKFHVLTTFML